jgi:hypothetical protein
MFYLRYSAPKHRSGKCTDTRTQCVQLFQASLFQFTSISVNTNSVHYQLYLPDVRSPEMYANLSVAFNGNKHFTHIEMLWGGSQTISFPLCSIHGAATFAARNAASFAGTTSSQQSLWEASACYFILSVEPPTETLLSLRLHQQSRSDRP